MALISEKRSALLASLRRHLTKKMRNKAEAALRMAELLLRISNVHVGFSTPFKCFNFAQKIQKYIFFIKCNIFTF